MYQQRNKLYLLLALACLAGYGYIFVMQQDLAGQVSQLGPVCLFKRLTHFPCPSCGATRAVLSLLQGQVGEALYWNPLGLLLFAILVFCPLWLSYDWIQKQDSLFRCYQKMECLLQRRAIAIPAGALVIGNWVWNIYKGL